MTVFGLGIGWALTKLASFAPSGTSAGGLIGAIAGWMGGTISNTDNDFSDMTPAQTVGMIAGIGAAAMIGAAAGFLIPAAAASSGVVILASAIAGSVVAEVIGALATSALEYLLPETGDPRGIAVGFETLS